MRARDAMRAAWLACLSCVVTACGGGGATGDGGGGTTNERVNIAAVVLSFPTGQSPPGFLVGDNNTGTAVEILAQDGVTPVSTATVSVNGVELTYFSGSGDYEGQLVVNPGEKVTVKVRVGSDNYSVSHSQFSTYPTIVAPAAGTTWTSLNSNIVRWSGAAERSEEHTSELQSLRHLVCRLLLEK